jgi:hypothetical protein
MDVIVLNKYIEIYAHRTDSIDIYISLDLAVRPVANSFLKSQLALTESHCK